MPEFLLDQGRDELLLKHSLIILERCLRFVESVDTAYHG
jgi:hypothetical protein